MKVVFDTNVYISAFVVPGGNAEAAFLGALERKFELYGSLAILAETAKKLNEKFNWPDQEIERALKIIAKAATLIKVEPYLQVLSDEPDNRIIEAALKAQADLIVTGDKHLLAFGRYKNIEIITLSNFIHQIKDEK